MADNSKSNDAHPRDEDGKFVEKDHGKSGTAMKGDTKSSGSKTDNKSDSKTSSSRSK